MWCVCDGVCILSVCECECVYMIVLHVCSVCVLCAYNCVCGGVGMHGVCTYVWFIVYVQYVCIYCLA